MTGRVETIGDCTLYLGDAFEIIPTVGPVDAVIMDPPYNFSTSSALGKLNPWADITNSAFWFSQLYKLCKARIVSGGCLWTCLNWRTLPTVMKAAFDADWHVESLLVWDKEWIGPGGSKGLRPSYELVALMTTGEFAIKDRGLPDVQRFAWSSQKPHGHPAEKPEALMAWLIEKSSAWSVLDPFMGSGTVGAAAISAGRSYVGIEADPRWFDVACRRLEKAANQPRLFAEPVAKPVQTAFDLEGAQ
jgi:site-specific DNA-methyltransferase (adenine-specific)